MKGGANSRGAAGVAGVAGERGASRGRGSGVGGDQLRGSGCTGRDGDRGRRVHVVGRRGAERGVLRFRMAGMLSGVPVEQTMWQAVKARDGKLCWWATFRTEREVL